MTIRKPMIDLMVIRTSFGLVISGNWLSNAESPPVGAMLPPSRSLSSSSKPASSTVANWLASSPRIAFSRSRKLEVEGEPDASLMSVWASLTENRQICHPGIFKPSQSMSSNSPPESKSSSEGNRSAMAGGSSRLLWGARSGRWETINAFGARE